MSDYRAVRLRAPALIRNYLRAWIGDIQSLEKGTYVLSNLSMYIISMKVITTPSLS